MPFFSITLFVVIIGIYTVGYSDLFMMLRLTGGFDSGDFFAH